MGLHTFFSIKYIDIIISIILGFGLATAFRQVCLLEDCLSFEAPDLSDLTSSTYKHDGKCYSYIPTSVKCDKNKKKLRFI
jgi:hypothetical protein